MSPLFVKQLLKMITKAEIVKLVEEKIEGTEYYIVDISVSSSNQIHVEIDGDKGVKINDCVQISRHIEGNYDREDVDREVEMKTTQGDKIKGILVSADDKAVVLEVTRKEKIEGKKKKQIVIENKTVPMEQVKETKVVISFK